MNDYKPKSKDELLCFEFELNCMGKRGEIMALLIVSRELEQIYPQFSEKIKKMYLNKLKISLPICEEKDITYAYQLGRIKNKQKLIINNYEYTKTK